MDGHENEQGLSSQPDATQGASEPMNPTPTASTEGGIFSGEDTRVETENLPTVPEVVQQAPASSISPTLRTTSTVTGDLQLGGTTKKKKWPLFVALGAVAVVVVVVVWLLMGNIKPSTPQEEVPTYHITDESRRLFHRYINFLLENNDSDGKPEFLDFLANKYTFLSPGAMFAEKIKQNDDIELARSYFNDLNTVYSEFDQAFFPPDNVNNDSDTEEEYSSNAISNYFYEAAKGSYLNLGQIIKLYLQNGEESVRNLLENTFRSGSENETVKSLLEARKRQMTLYLDAVVQANQDGCIVNGSLNTVCATPKFSAVEGEAAKLAIQAMNLETELRQDAIMNLENIYYAFYPDEAVAEGSTS